MFEPVKIALGCYMAGFYAGIVPTTTALKEYCARGLEKSIAFAPSRMVDAAEEMLASWQRNDTDGATTRPAKLPVILVAVAKDYIPVGRDYTRQTPESQWVILPGDAKERVFSLRTLAGEIRAQILIVASDEPTARSLAAQFLLYTDAVDEHRFNAEYSFAGVVSKFPVQLESTDIPAQSIATEAKNLTMLALDLSLRATVPLFSSPKDGEPNDGKGTDGDENDPHGFLVVVQTNGDYVEVKP